MELPVENIRVFEATSIMAVTSLLSSLTILGLIFRNKKRFEDRFPLLMHCITPMCICDVVWSCVVITVAYPAAAGQVRCERVWVCGGAVWAAFRAPARTGSASRSSRWETVLGASQRRCLATHRR